VLRRILSLHEKGSKIRWFWAFALLSFSLFSSNATVRRIGKLDTSSWSPYYGLGVNASPFESSGQFPDFSPVGALVSKEGFLGTGTLVAPSVVVTAAHLFRNSLSSPLPISEDWHFILHSPFDQAPESQKYVVSKVILHPGWVARLSQLGGQGDGDMLGVDLAIVLLKEEVVGVYPAKLPLEGIEPLGAKVVLSGFGNLVDGRNGSLGTGNKRRVGGVNILDRVVVQVEDTSIPSEYLGGLLAIDFDSPQLNANRLGSGEPALDYIPFGSSDAMPVELEASTAVGDSGGPAFMKIGDAWRIVGSVSYGSSDSTYGDVTVYTRIANHKSWVESFLPAWSQSRKTDYSGWLESDWFGFFFPEALNWNYHSSHGWLYLPQTSQESFWAWQPNLGWWWSGLTVYPFIYSSKRASWLYFGASQSTPFKSVFYDYAMGTWVELP
jgi:hypothetical protein